MKCPICTDMQLIMSDRLGIRIDYCPHCRGAWLGRTGLEKLIERSINLPPEPLPAVHLQHDAPRPQRILSGKDQCHAYIKEGYGQKQRKNLLAELFDF